MPRVTPEGSRAVCEAVQEATGRRLLGAAHALHLGGLGLGLARLCLAGGVGVRADLRRVPGGQGLDDVTLLFSESGSRFLLTCPEESGPSLEALLLGHGVSWARFGVMSPSAQLHLASGERVTVRDLEYLRGRYREALDA